VNRHGSIDITGGLTASMPSPPPELRAQAYSEYPSYKSSSNVHVSRSGSVMVGGAQGSEYSASLYNGSAAPANTSDPLPSVEEMMAQIRAKVRQAGGR
tara:strand:- start:124 stop:417 length:294 start_codon:yes stop_codon:yes gene_type:complete